MADDISVSRNSSRWRFIWEAASHKPVIVLYVFDESTKPSNDCSDLTADLRIVDSLLVLSWIQHVHISFVVPLPNVLLDVDAPVFSRFLEDCIEVKLALLLPVDHPIVFGSNSLLNFPESKRYQEDVIYNNTDARLLSSKESVQFYCRNCSSRLTRRAIRTFIETPSVNWREAADNWFGTGCCSFGGISEKLVNRYSELNKCQPNTCLVSSTTLILHKDDFLVFRSPDCDDALNNITKGESVGNSVYNNGSKISEVYSEQNLFSVNLVGEVVGSTGGHISSDLVNGCHICPHGVASSEVLEHSNGYCIIQNLKSFDGEFPGDPFMIQSSNMSKDVEWIEFVCPRCFFPLGALPSFIGSRTHDGMVHLFKWAISTALPVRGYNDLFRMHTMEKMFSHQLLQSAKDELAFKTIINNMKSKTASIQVVLINSESWCSGGFCHPNEGQRQVHSKTDLQPVIKVLFSECNNDTISEAREHTRISEMDEVYMFTHQIAELVALLKSSMNMYPHSRIPVQGLSLSHIKR